MASCPGIEFEACSATCGHGAGMTCVRDTFCMTVAEDKNIADQVAKTLFEYLCDVIYKPAHATLDVASLPQGFHDLGEGLLYLAACVAEAKSLAQALSKGDLSGPLPSRGNEIAAPLKSLHASLQHLTWQTQQVAK